jgi:hypothetical protein
MERTSREEEAAFSKGRPKRASFAGAACAQLKKRQQQSRFILKQGKWMRDGKQKVCCDRSRSEQR